MALKRCTGANNKGGCKAGFTPPRARKDGDRHHLIRPLFTEDYACSQVCKSFFAYLSDGHLAHDRAYQAGRGYLACILGTAGCFGPCALKLGILLPLSPFLG